MNNSKAYRVSKDDLTLREYNSLIDIPILTNLPCDDEWYYRCDNGDVWEVKKFEGENAKRLDAVLDTIKETSSKINALKAFGVI
jgi:hypothetical protein